MPAQRGFEVQALASGAILALVSIPTDADAMRIRVEGATCRWLTSATPNASVGLAITPADPPLIIARSDLSRFHLYALVGAAVNVEYYSGADQFRL